MRPARSAALAGLAILGIGAAVVIAIMLTRPGGLPARAVSSVPELFSEPVGVQGGDLVLAPDGLGPVTFGEGEDAVIAAMTKSLGAPVEDAPQPCDSTTDVVRSVRWGNLTASFPDGRFGGYIIGIYFPPDSAELSIETAEGVALRAAVHDLTAAYADRLGWFGQENSGFEHPIDAFGIDGFDLNNPTPTGLGGYVEGGREEGQVITFVAGQPCGPR